MQVHIIINDLNTETENLVLRSSDNIEQVYINIGGDEVLVNINEIKLALRKLSVKE